METAENEKIDGSGNRRRRKKLTAEQKWQIFLETGAKNAPVGEILRRHGLYSSELTKIRQQVEAGALKELGKNRHKKKEAVPYEHYARLEAELFAKEKALAQMGEEYLLLKKRVS
jgi:transposase-like protein